MRRLFAATCLILCLSMAACAVYAAGDVRVGGGARPAEAPSAPDDYALAGRWLRLGMFDYINPERGLVLRISEMPDGTYDAWGVYLIDLRAGTSEPLCRLDERIAKSGKEGSGSLYLRACGLWLSLKKDRLWVHATEGGKEGPTLVPVSVLYEIELPAGKLKRLMERSDRQGWTNAWYYGAGWTIGADEQHVVYPLKQDTKGVAFERARMDGTGAKEVLSLPSANLVQMYPLAFARNGTCLASQMVQSQQLYCIRPGNARPELLKGPPERSVFRAEPDSTGLGFLAVCNSSPHLGYDFRSELELWSFSPGRKEAWTKHAALPATHSAYAAWAYGWGSWGGMGGICPASDGKRAYMVQSQLRIDRRDDKDVPPGYCYTYGYNGWGFGHGDGRFTVFEVNLENGEVKALWTHHDMERAFYAKREPDKKAGEKDAGDDGLEIGKAER